MSKVNKETKRYYGYLLIDSGYKVEFDESECDIDSQLLEHYNNSKMFDSDFIYLNSDSTGLCIFTNRIIGININEYEE